jgi:predicted signal transduction protein with EAL and GGDEF domain
MSFGVLLSADWGPRSVEELLHEVDIALYQAKDAGRDCLRMAKPDAKTEAPQAALPQPVRRAR